MADQPGSLSPAEGRLLVASPAMGDPTFGGTVVGLLEHDDAVGSLGVVLNRPSSLPIGEVLADWEQVASQPAVLFTGGPVARGSALGLALIAEGAVGSRWTAIFDRLAIVDLERPPRALQPDLERVRLYNGYAGWGAGQLRRELALGAWWVFDAATSDWFAEQPEQLRAEVLRRQGPRWRLWANAPDDLRSN